MHTGILRVLRAEKLELTDAIKGASSCNFDNFSTDQVVIELTEITK